MRWGLWRGEGGGGIQICINDVSVDNNDDVNENDDDLNLETIRRQKRRSSWCPEKERKKDEKEEKQRMLGVAGRRYIISIVAFCISLYFLIVVDKCFLSSRLR